MYKVIVWWRVGSVLRLCLNAMAYTLSMPCYYVAKITMLNHFKPSTSNRIKTG